MASTLVFASLWALASFHAVAEPLSDPSRLSCDVTYAGETQHIAIAHTQDPYNQASVRIRNRFRFKAVHVQGGDATPRIGIYVYLETPQQPMLIQHVLVQPPYPATQDSKRVDLVGEQRLYAGALERELIYRCFLEKAAP